MLDVGVQKEHFQIESAGREGVVRQSDFALFLKTFGEVVEQLTAVLLESLMVLFGAVFGDDGI